MEKLTKKFLTKFIQNPKSDSYTFSNGRELVVDQVDGTDDYDVKVVCNADETKLGLYEGDIIEKKRVALKDLKDVLETMSDYADDQGTGKTYEWCSECEDEVKLPTTLGIYKCPSCNKLIINCSMCIHKECQNCPFSKILAKN